jgi:hypothetical protein
VRTLENGPLITVLEGRWHYDSSRTTLYDAQSQLSSTFKDSIRPGTLLTIGPVQWRYTGILREDHAYTRQGDTLSVCRVGTNSWLISVTLAQTGFAK